MTVFLLRWLSQDIHSLVYIFILSFVVQAHAQQLDISCASVKGLNSEGVITDYGDVRGNIAIAVQEASIIANNAKTVLENSANGKASPFDNTRATQSFNTFQGVADQSQASTDRWSKVLSKFPEQFNLIYVALKLRFLL